MTRSPADPLGRFGVRLILPAMVIGAFGGSLIDMLVVESGYPFARLGVVVGPVFFAIAINALSRLEAARRGPSAVESEAYRRAETEKRMDAARRRGDLIRFER